MEYQQLGHTFKLKLTSQRKDCEPRLSISPDEPDPKTRAVPDSLPLPEVGGDIIIPAGGILVD